MLSLEYSSLTSSIGNEDTLKIVPSSVSCSFQGRVTACEIVGGSRAVNTDSLVLLEELQFCPGLCGRRLVVVTGLDYSYSYWYDLQLQGYRYGYSGTAKG